MTDDELNRVFGAVREMITKCYSDLTALRFALTAKKLISYQDFDAARTLVVRHVEGLKSDPTAEGDLGLEEFLKNFEGPIQ